jgi:hypothetical protein
MAAMVMSMYRVGAQEDATATVTGGVGATWESRYISEGRNNLDEGGLFTSVLDAGTDLPVGELGLSSSYSSGYDVDYTEINLGAGWTVPLGDFEATAGYTYLDFYSDDEDDHEISLDVAYTGLDFLTPFVGGYYSFESEGSFIEAGLSASCACRSNLSLEPFALIGFNEGYVADGHDGANHVAAGVNASLALKENLSVDASLTYTAAIDKNEDRYADDASLENELYGSVGLVASF